METEVPVATVERALRTGDPLPGTAGFAGALPDGRLVRDVLGRRPLFYDADGRWRRDRRALDDPRRLPAGHVWEDGASTRAWTLPASEPVAPDRAVADLEAALARTLEGVTDDGLAVAFSGGVDSAVVASAVDAPLYVAGFPDGHDVEAARSAARLLGRGSDLRVIELDHDALRAAVPEVARATGRTNAMDVGIALAPYLVARRAAADGHGRLAVGQGADELFGGYAKVARAPTDARVEADTVRGARDELLATLPDQLERDVLAIRAAGVEPVAPLLHDRIVRAALALPGALLVRRGDRDEPIRKAAFRRAARAFVPDAVATREKKAMQYGSLIARELDRLARRAGYKRRMDDHVTRYVESLLDG